MMHAAPDEQRRTARRNRGVAFACAGVFVGMVALSYASVPLYRIFCQATGFGGTPQIAEAAPVAISDKTIEVRFDANVAPGLDWQFRPEAPSVRLKLGETTLAFYRAANTGANASTGTAIFNVTPEWAGQYFNKIECFCFTEQALAAGESADLPVSFFVDPAILDDTGGKELPAITLSYTFYRAETPVASVTGPQAGSGGS